MTTMVRLPKAFNEIDADRTDCTLLRINSGVLSDDVIPLCAAYAAQDKGRSSGDQVPPKSCRNRRIRG